jgi:hypothetical protein
MDPDAALATARSALAAIRAGEDSHGEHMTDAKDDLVDAFEALDGWISRGGFLPAAWKGE